MKDSVVKMFFDFLPLIPKKATELSWSGTLPKNHRIFEFSAGTLICLPSDCDVKYVFCKFFFELGYY